MTTLPECGCALCWAKGRPATPVLDDLHMRCDFCGCFGVPRALAGYCYCGAKNWENTSPIEVPLRHVQPVAQVAPSARSAPRLVPPPVSAFGGAFGGEPAGPPWPPSDPAVVHGPPRLVSGSTTTRKMVDDYEGARMNELLGGIMRGAVVLIVGAGGRGQEHRDRRADGPCRPPMELPGALARRRPTGPGARAHVVRDRGIRGLLRAAGQRADVGGPRPAVHVGRGPARSRKTRASWWLTRSRRG